MMRERGGRQSGAGAVEYVGMVVLAAVLFVGLLVVFPSSGEQLACKVSQAIGSITGDPVSCSGGASPGGTRAVPDSTVFVDPRTTDTGPGTSRVEFVVDVPEGESWTVESDQPWLTVPDSRVFDGPVINAGQHGGGNGPGRLTATVHANPSTSGVSRTATLTFTGPDGERFTQEIAQPGGTAQTVVLGDSFSAGNGAVEHGMFNRREPNVDPESMGSGFPPTKRGWICRRSSMSWGRQIEAGTSTAAGTPSISLSRFGACSGATVTGTDLVGGSGSSALLDQIEASREALAEADQVAFSIGGNDIAFASIVADCAAPYGLSTVKKCHDAVVQGKLRINGESGQPSPLGQKLEQAYREVLEAAPNATVYVVGYPPMVELDDTGGGFLDWGEVEPENRWEVVDMIDDLNSQIAASVNTVNMSTEGGARLVFVDPTKEGSGFQGHSLTDDDPYYEGLDIDKSGLAAEPWSYHPNIAGNAAYARWIGWHMLGER